MQPEKNEKRYLIVVEHVSDLVEWDIIRRMCLPDMSNKGSRIVVLTQHLGRVAHQLLRGEHVPDVSATMAP